MLNSYFFFQAEVGIRDGTVTGVQTCALPILASATPRKDPSTNLRVSPTLAEMDVGTSPTNDLLDAGFLGGVVVCAAMLRSEERRVGKECGSESGPDEC